VISKVITKVVIITKVMYKIKGYALTIKHRRLIVRHSLILKGVAKRLLLCLYIRYC